MKKKDDAKEKARKPLPPKVVNLLLARSCGRCQYEGCNEVLTKDILTKKNYNTAYIAHIVAAEPNGPRGDEALSPRLCQDFENLMLLCDRHHRLIDREDIAGHSVERLVSMKRSHESLMERLTNFKNKKETEILLFGANIGKQGIPLFYDSAHETIIDSHYPASQYGIQLGLLNSGVLDHRKEFWLMEHANLIANFDTKIKHQRESGIIKHLSVFCLAPQPLLILLGSLLGDIHHTEVYQLHREPKTWKWLNEADPLIYEIKRPEKNHTKIALKIALSANITDDRIVKVLGEDCSIWTFTVNTPHNDLIRNKEHLERFRQQIRLLMNEIKTVHGQDNIIHVFPAMPISTAVELGRVRMPKADLPLLIYDQNYQNPNMGFYETFKIE
ncbi:SAVED domain-containing protein [Flectobacillus rivi]|uniref:SAVED domain-containing protein n=1 Tax=Flectobacillus rivi TaxID=2984209 RepID=A0ABT6Z1M1_9BACT|nr:SAVED domain-containing protein [Flectobacillus rivi]MDI9874997.1 SAVED domain-containing protein [Flectobacillus rivi]